MKNKIIISLLFMLPVLVFGQTSKPVLQKQVEHLQDSLNRRADTAWVDSNFANAITVSPLVTSNTISLLNKNGNPIGAATLSPVNTTTHTAGLMLYIDKTKLDGIADGANNYTLPTASASVLGGIKVGSRLSIASGILSADNMIQTLALAGNTLSISGGNSVTLPTVNDATISIKNGATTLGSFTTNQGTAGSIDISSAIPATPTLQQVSTSGNTTTNSLFFRLKTNSYYLDDAGNNRIFIGNATNANGIIFQNSQSTQTFQFRNSAATNVASIANDGSITSAALAGTGTRMVVTDASGNLAAQAIPVSQPNGFVKINSDYTVQSTDKDILIYSGSDSFVHITMPDPTTNTNRDLNIYINRQILNGTSPEYLDLYFDSYDYYFYAGGVGHYNLFENTNFAVYPHFRMFKLKSDGTHWYILNFPQDFNQ